LALDCDRHIERAESGSWTFSFALHNKSPLRKTTSEQKLLTACQLSV
jgi:hypothetical protein